MNILGTFAIGFTIGYLIELFIALVFDFFEKNPFKVNHKFTLFKKISLFSLPIWGLLAVLIQYNTGYIRIFLYTAVLGTILEYTLGKFLHTTFGIKLWTYRYGDLGKFTSIYSIPYWGLVGVIMAAAVKIIGV